MALACIVISIDGFPVYQTSVGRRPIMFESEDFVGKAAIWVRNLPSAPPDLFKGQRRKSRVTMQVRTQSDTRSRRRPPPPPPPAPSPQVLSTAFTLQLSDLEGV